MSRRTHERLAMLEAASTVTQGEVPAALCERDERVWDGDPEEFLDDQLASIVTAATAASGERVRRASAQIDESESGNLEERAELLARVREFVLPGFARFIVVKKPARAAR